MRPCYLVPFRWCVKVEGPTCVPFPGLEQDSSRRCQDCRVGADGDWLSFTPLWFFLHAVEFCDLSGVAHVV